MQRPEIIRKDQDGTSAKALGRKQNQITDKKYIAEQIHHKAEENMNKVLHGIKKIRKHFLFETRNQIRDRIQKSDDKRREEEKK